MEQQSTSIGEIQCWGAFFFFRIDV